MANLLSRKSLPRENFIPQTTSDGDNRLWGEQIFDRNYFQRQIHTELNKYWHNICINQSNMFILNFCWNPCSKLFLCSDALLIQRGDFVQKLELQLPWPLINEIRQFFGIIFAVTKPYKIVKVSESMLCQILILSHDFSTEIIKEPSSWHRADINREQVLWMENIDTIV